MKTKFAVIGYGGQGGWHTEQIKKSDVAELVGVFDNRKEKRTLAEERGLKAYPSLKALLADDEIEAVVIATPNDEHKELCEAALEAGKHVICEKPVTLSVEDFDEIAELANQKNLIFTVHQNRRWDVDFLAVKSVAESGDIGKVINIESRVHGSRGIPSDWRTKKKHGGGMILDWGVHLIDQMLQIIKSEIVSVYCEETHITNKEVDDGFKLMLTFADGKKALIEVGTYNFLPLPRFYMQCKKGTMVIRDWREEGHVARLKAWNEKEIVPVETASGITKTMSPRDDITLDEYNVERPTSDVHDYYRNFCKAIRGEEEIIVKHDEIRRVLKVMEAALRSGETGEAVKTSI